VLDVLVTGIVLLVTCVVAILARRPIADATRDRQKARGYEEVASRMTPRIVALVALVGSCIAIFLIFVAVRSL